MSDIVVHIQFVGSGSFCNAVDDCTGLGSLGRAIAVIYSISETAKLNNLRPYYYFNYLLTELPKICDEKGTIDTAKLEHLLPWAPELPEECRKTCR